MIKIEIKELLEAGFHFGHQRERWNPKMKPFLYGDRGGVHIIDLAKAANLFQTALNFIAESVGEGQDVLFVATKRQAQDLVKTEAERCGMYYVNNRWMGGTLTNFRTVKASIDRLKKLIKGKADGSFEDLKKAEKLRIDREIQRLEKSLSGIKEMNRVAQLVVLIDPNKEHLALKEALRLGIPVIALTDTNCDPDDIEYVVPGNDDATRSIKLFFSKVADAVLAGMSLRETKARRSAVEAEEKPAVRETGGRKADAYVAKPEASEDEEVTADVYSAKPIVEAEASTMEKQHQD